MAEVVARNRSAQVPSNHALVRALQRESESSPFVFVSERGGAFHDGRFRPDGRARCPMPRASNSKRTPTCSATPAATPSPTRAMTPGQSRRGSGDASPPLEAILRNLPKLTADERELVRK